MKKLIDMIVSGRAVEELKALLVAAIPAIIIGAIFIAAYFILIKYFEEKNQNDKAKFLINLTPYLYMVFLVFIYLSPINPRDARLFDPSFNFTLGIAFHFVADIILFIPLSLLFQLTKKNYIFSVAIPAGSLIIIELLQYVTKFGVATVRNVVAGLIGTVIGIGIAHIIFAVKKKKAG